MNFIKSLGVQAKILLVFTCINLAATVVYTLFIYELKTENIYEASDARLTAAVHAVPRMLPTDYLDQPLKAPSVFDYLEHTRSLYSYSQLAGLRYVYIFVQEHEKGPIFYLADAASDAEIQVNKYGQFLQTYQLPPPELTQTLLDGQQRFAEYTDEFGQFRSLFIRGVRKDGIPYVIGGDIDMSYLQERLVDALQKSLLIGLGIFLLCLLLSWYLARSLARPVLELLQVTQRIAKREYDVKYQPHGRDEVGQLAAGLNAMGMAIAEREQAMLELIYHDKLTGLGNRLALDEALTSALDSQQNGVLVLVHLNQLRAINDLLGFSAGDTVLKVLANRLTSMWGNDKKDDTNATSSNKQNYRLGGKVFALLATGLNTSDSNTIYQLVSQALESNPVTLDDQRIDLAVTLGIVYFPRHGNLAGAVVRNAEVALYTAKNTQKRWSEYSDDLVVSRREQLSLLGELQRAVEQNELHVFYQPQVDIKHGELVQAEALIRWHHPDRGWLPPSAFIPFAEQTGRIRMLTAWVLNQVAQQVTIWRNSVAPLTVSVNLAVRDLEDPDFSTRVADILLRHGALARDICLEITETGLMIDREQACATLDILHRAGHRISIDDFGTGYSSLSYLSRLPVSELKIDRSFINDPSTHNLSIVRSTIGLGHALKLDVVAEGVETEAQLHGLAAMGCDTAQGYLIARPMPCDAFNTWRKEWRVPIWSSNGRLL
jgi:diguanylate cyclase (GGDEF)-like protein